MNELKTLAQRLRYAMEVLPPKKIKGVDLARAVGVKPPSVSDWLSGKSKTMEGENLLKAAKHLKVNPVWLATGTGKIEVEQSNNSNRDSANESHLLDNNVDLSQKIPLTGRPVPVISWVAAGSFSTIDTVLKDAEVDEYLPPNNDCGKNGYGLVVTGYSMAPKFEPNDRIYVNPDFQVGDLKTNDLVIIACAGNTEATFKKIIIEGQDKFLEPLNPDWPEKIIKMPEDCRLMGKVVGLHRKF